LEFYVKFLNHLWQILRRFNAWTNGTPGKITFHVLNDQPAHGVIRVASNQWIGYQIPIRFHCEFDYGLHSPEHFHLLRREIITQALEWQLQPLSFVVFSEDGVTSDQEYIVTHLERAGIIE
jgi:hypothetical protein